MDERLFVSRGGVCAIVVSEGPPRIRGSGLKLVSTPCAKQSCLAGKPLAFFLHAFLFLLLMAPPSKAHSSIPEKDDQRFEQLFRNNPALMALSSMPDRHLMDVNESFLTTLGYRREEVVGKTSAELGLFVDPERQALVAETLAKEGSVKGFELRIRRKDGKILTGLFSGDVIEDHNGQYFLTVMLDITERKQAEADLAEWTRIFMIVLAVLIVLLLVLVLWLAASRRQYKKMGEALRESETLLSGVARQVPGVLYQFYVRPNGEMGLYYVSEKAQQIVGIKAGEPNYFERFSELILPEYREGFFQSIETSVRERSEWHYEGMLQKPTGEKIWFSGSATPLDKEGEIVFNGIIQDITDRKRAEEALRESEERYCAITETAVDSIFCKDLQSRYTFINPAMEQLLGKPSAELLGRTPRELFDPESAAIVEAADAPVLKGGVTNSVRTLAIQGEHRTFHTIQVPLRNAQGEPSGMCGIVRDITEQRRSEEENEKLQAQLIQAQKMESVGRLAGGVAHDFNNMLGVILGNTELAIEEAPPLATLQGALQEIRKAAQRSADLTRQLLAFARKQTIAPKELVLNETITGMLLMLKRLIGENIELVWKPGHELWPVRMDASQLDQVVTNLCLNARDAIADIGQITLETSNVVCDESAAKECPDLAPGKYVRLAVSDTGCGMDQETLAHIFEPFFTTKDVGQGTGLGLATIYGAVKQNKGFIHAYSEPGTGTTISLYLPRLEGRVEEGSEPPAVSAPPETGHETILLVEDEPAILHITRTMIERLGYAVVVAATPGEAIHKARDHAGAIDLLLTDVMMPEMNGRDLAKNLMSLYPNLKNVFMSGYTADVIAHHGVLEAGTFFLQKPFTMNELGAKLREALKPS